MEDQIQQPIEPTMPSPSPIVENSNSNFWKYIGVGMSIVSFCIAIGAIGYIYSINKKSPTLTACTMEAKLCPDGKTSVGRSGPKCEFAPCPTPTVDPTANWKTYSDSEYSIKYPENYQIKNSTDKNDNVFYLPKVNDTADFQEEINIYKQTTTVANVCDKKPDGYPNASCTKIGEITFLDWHSDTANVMGPTSYNYSAINNGVNYQISLLGLSKEKAIQILSTFKFTQ